MLNLYGQMLNQGLSSHVLSTCKSWASSWYESCTVTCHTAVSCLMRHVSGFVPGDGTWFLCILLASYQHGMCWVSFLVQINMLRLYMRSLKLCNVPVMLLHILTSVCLGQTIIFGTCRHRIENNSAPFSIFEVVIKLKEYWKFSSIIASVHNHQK